MLETLRSLRSRKFLARCARANHLNPAIPVWHIWPGVLAARPHLILGSWAHTEPAKKPFGASK